MERLKKHKRIWFWVGFGASVLGAAAIPGLVLSIINELWLLMSLCIALVADILYGVPLYWVTFGKMCSREALLGVITESGIRSVTDIALHTGRTEKQTVIDVKDLIDKRYLTELQFDGERLFPFKKPEPPLKKVPTGMYCDWCRSKYPYREDVYKCPSCGAALTYEYEDKE